MASHRTGQLFDEQGGYNTLVYQPYKRMHLRNILFNNEVLLRIAEATRIARPPGRSGYRG